MVTLDSHVPQYLAYFIFLYPTRLAKKIKKWNNKKIVVVIIIIIIIITIIIIIIIIIIAT